jgi:pyridoxal biosynthesis lyase PdxS
VIGGVTGYMRDEFRADVPPSCVRELARARLTTVASTGAARHLLLDNLAAVQPTVAAMAAAVAVQALEAVPADNGAVDRWPRCSQVFTLPLRGS